MQVLLGLIAIIWLISSIGLSGFFWLIGIFFVSALVIAFIQGNQEKSKVESALRLDILQAKSDAIDCKSLIQRNLKELATKRQMLVTDGGYGTKDTSRWEREKKKFIAKVIKKGEAKDLAITDDSISELIDSLIDKDGPILNLNKTGYSEKLSGLEYEHHCAGILKSAGWDAKTTVASGDQGADVIATKRGKRVVIQCKKYSQPVGNKAVQEAHAAKAFYDASHAVVVSNNTYTQSAKEAANRLGVLLIHHNDLSALDRNLS